MARGPGPVVIRRRLGSVLKQLRAQQGLHLDAVARQLEISPSKLSRVETGQVEPKIRDVRDLLEIYQAGPEIREQIMRWATDAKEPGWWQPFAVQVTADLDLYISLEAEATAVKIYSLPINGLLQTERYARAILGGALPDLDANEIDTLVRIRLGRQAVLAADRPDAPPMRLHAILDEAALRRGPRDSDVMLEQLSALIDHSGRENITLQILPFDAGATRVSSTFAIFEPRLANDWPVANVESTGVDAYFDTPNEISKYRSIWKNVVTNSLDEEASRELIRDVVAQRGG